MVYKTSSFLVTIEEFELGLSDLVLFSIPTS